MTASRFVKEIALVVLCVGSAIALGAAQGQAPTAGRGIAASDYPVLPIGSPLPEFTLEGIDGKMHKSSDTRRPRRSPSYSRASIARSPSTTKGAPRSSTGPIATKA